MYYRLADFINKKFRIDAHYFLKGGFWLSITQMIMIASGVVTTALYAHYLSATTYGVYRYLIGLAVIFSSFSLTGLGEAILQTSAKKYFNFYKESLRTNFYYNTLMMLMALVGSAYYWFNQNKVLSLGCVLIALLQPAINAFQYTPALLQGSKRFRESTILQGVRTIVVALVTVGALLLTQNVLILFSVYLGSNLLINLITQLFYKPTESTATPKEAYDQYLAYAKHTSIRNFISTVAFRFDTVLIFTRLGSIELAIFTIATIVPEQIKASFKNIAALLLPKYAAHPDFETLKKGIRKRSLELFFILLFITILYVFAAPFIYSLFFPKYQSAILYSQLFALTFPAYIYFIPLTVMMAKLDEKKLYDFHVRTSIFQFFTVLVLIFFFGLIGAIISRIVVQYVRMAYCYWLTFKAANN
jgi:O-antigen/teichoic acid export membrane protein